MSFSNIDLNYPRKEEDWHRILLSKSDCSVHILRIYMSLRAIFTQCLTDILLTNINCIYVLFRESRYIAFHDGMGVGSTAFLHPWHNIL